MATIGKTNWKYVGSTALTGGECLKWSAKDKLDIAGAVDDKFVGVAAEACAAGNVTPQNISIWTPGNCPGTVQCIASAAITAGVFVTMAASGKIVTASPKATYEASAVEVIIGIANEAAAADLDVIDVIWFVGTSQSLT